MGVGFLILAMGIIAFISVVISAMGIIGAISVVIWLLWSSGPDDPDDMTFT